MGKRSYGVGTIVPRGKNTFRLRYTIDRVRYSKTVTGSKADAVKELRALLKSGDEGSHVAPVQITVGEWIEQWLDAGAPGRRRKKVSQRTLERYGQLLRTHVAPVLGKRPLQQLKATEIDRLYAAKAAAADIAPRTQHHVHVVFGAMLATAERKGLIAVNPMTRVEQVPNPDGQIADDDLAEVDTDDIGEGLEEAELKALISGFGKSSLYSIVATAAATGARRNELLANRWTDLDVVKKTLRIERAWEQTKKFGLRLKPPKTKRGLRTISLDDATVAMLVAEREKHRRHHAGILHGVGDNLSLIRDRLPAGALMFPKPPEIGKEIDFTAPRNPRNFSKEYARRAEVIAKAVGLPQIAKTRFHDLRGIHTTALLDAGIPVHTVAQRIGDDPAVVLRNYAKRKRTKVADANLDDAIGKFAAGFLERS